MLLVVPKNEIPSAVVALPGLAQLRTLLPSTVLQLHASPGAFRDETNLDLCRRVPAWRAPGEGDDLRRLVGRNPADFEFLAVGRPLVESSANASLQVQLALLAAEASRPPLADLFAEQPERNLRRAFHFDRLSDRHSISPRRHSAGTPEDLLPTS